MVGSINTRCRSILNVLETTVSEVVKHNGVLIVAGDLIDVVRPEAPILAECQRILGECTTVLLKGNHESNSDVPNDNALSPLAPVDRKSVV